MNSCWVIRYSTIFMYGNAFYVCVFVFELLCSPWHSLLSYSLQFLCLNNVFHAVKFLKESMWDLQGVSVMILSTFEWCKVATRLVSSVCSKSYLWFLLWKCVFVSSLIVENLNSVQSATLKISIEFFFNFVSTISLLQWISYYPYMTTKCNLDLCKHYSVP